MVNSVDGCMQAGLLGLCKARLRPVPCTPLHLSADECCDVTLGALNAGQRLHFCPEMGLERQT